MEKIRPILITVVRVLFILIITGTSILSLATAYIMFAPDNFPKPFYLVYQYPGEEIPYVSPNTSPGISSQSAQSEQIVSPPNTTKQIEGPSQPSQQQQNNPNYQGYNVAPGQGIFFDTGVKINNLADAGGREVLSRIGVTLEFAPNDIDKYNAYLQSQSSGGGEQSKKPADEGPEPDYVTVFLAELEGKKPLIDDVVNMVISSHTYEDLYTSEGKEILKEEIKTEINNRLSGYTVIAVYFTEFVLSR